MKTTSGEVKPTGITHDRKERTLLITWNDGHESVYPLDILREICPCVECRGGHERMGAEHDPDLLTLKPARSYELKDLQLVGNYALQLFWDDGHSSGIYSWQYLRRMCPCDQCTAGRTSAH